jgi:hypothetical protein
MNTVRTWAARRRTWRTPIVVSSCLVTSTSTLTGGRYCTQPHPGLARQHRAAASQISLCRVLSLLDCCAHDLGLLPPFQTPYAWQRRLASLRGECYCVQLTVLRCHIQLSSDPVLKQCQSLRRHILAVPMQGTKGWTPANANASKQPFLYVKQCGETRKN